MLACVLYFDLVSNCLFSCCGSLYRCFVSQCINYYSHRASVEKDGTLGTALSNNLESAATPHITPAQRIHTPTTLRQPAPRSLPPPRTVIRTLPWSVCVPWLHSLCMYTGESAQEGGKVSFQRHMRGNSTRLNGFLYPCHCSGHLSRHNICSDSYFHVHVSSSVVLPLLQSRWIVSVSLFNVQNSRSFLLT